jgi:hypothetical protein
LTQLVKRTGQNIAIGQVGCNGSIACFEGIGVWLKTGNSAVAQDRGFLKGIEIMKDGAVKLCTIPQTYNRYFDFFCPVSSFLST